MKQTYHTIPEALEDLRAGKVILVTDDPDRENEGDMICAGEFATQENINFMACQAKEMCIRDRHGAVPRSEGKAGAGQHHRRGSGILDGERFTVSARDRLSGHEGAGVCF